MKRARIATWIALAPLALTACSDESGRTAEALEDFRRGFDATMEEAGVALDGLRDLGAAQKSVFVERARERLAELDGDLERLRAEAEEKGEELAEVSRAKLERLEEQRRELGPQLERLEDASGDAFVELRDGFVAAVETFNETARRPVVEPAGDGR